MMKKNLLKLWSFWNFVCLVLNIFLCRWCLNRESSLQDLPEWSLSSRRVAEDSRPTCIHLHGPCCSYEVEPQSLTQSSPPQLRKPWFITHPHHPRKSLGQAWRMAKSREKFSSSPKSWTKCSCFAAPKSQNDQPFCCIFLITGSARTYFETPCHAKKERPPFPSSDT